MKSSPPRSRGEIVSRTRWEELNFDQNDVSRGSRPRHDSDEDIPRRPTDDHFDEPRTRYRHDSDDDLDIPRTRTANAAPDSSTTVVRDKYGRNTCAINVFLPASWIGNIIDAAAEKQRKTEEKRALDERDKLWGQGQVQLREKEDRRRKLQKAKNMTFSR